MTPAPAVTEQLTPVEKAALIAAAGSSVAVVLSIAVSQILLGAAILLLIAGRIRPQLPAAWPPIAAFIVLTAVSLLASGDPRAGWPQIRKFFVYLTLVTIFTTVKRSAWGRNIVWCWAGAACVEAIAAAIQFVGKVQGARQEHSPLYQYYVGRRVRGFLSHWQTFGGLEMLVLVMLTAFLLFSPRARGWARWLAMAAWIAVAVALLGSFTRGIWIAFAFAAVYLVWSWRRIAVLVLPVLLALLMWLNPGGVGSRAISVVRPHGLWDSNEFHMICWRTGLRMIEAHPWLGLGPEMVRIKFMQWVPEDIPRPLPIGWYGHLHNIYLHYAAERGILAALVFVSILLKMLWDFGRALRRAPPGRSEERFLLHGATAAVLASMVSGVFEVNLGDSEVLTLFLAIAALGYVAAREVRRG